MGQTSKPQVSPTLEPERFKKPQRHPQVNSGIEPQRRAKAESRSLFHYTRADGLIGILRSGSLFATHANFLNDTSECKILADLLKPLLAAENDNLIKRLIERKMLSEEILREYGRYVGSLQADKALEAIASATENVAPIYICSFCIHSEADDAFQNGLLSQWRGYADGGFAIEFDELELDKLLRAEKESFKYQGILSNTVSYSDHAERANLPAFDGLATILTRRLFERASDGSNEKMLDEIFGRKRFDDYLNAYLGAVPFLKHSGFAEENEYRIAAFCNRPGRSDPSDKRKYKEVKFRGGRALSPYIELFSGLGNQLPIKRILVGPHSQQENQERALKLLLDQFNLSVPVVCSNVTLRG